MKKIGLACVTILAGLSLAGCNNLASQSHKTASSSSSTKVVKHHKNHKQANKASHKNKQSSSSSSQATANNNATSQQGNNGNQQATAQSNNNGQQQRQPQSEPTNQGNGEQVYTAHPSQGGTIYQTNGNAGSFQGDPDTIAETQIKMEQAAQRIQNGQQ